MTASRTPVIVGIGLSDGPVAPHLDAVQHHVVAMRLLDAARARGLAGDPATRQRLAEVYTGEQLLRFLGYRAKTALGRDEPLGPLASSINLFFAGHLKRTGDVVLSVLGADGLVRSTVDGTGDADWTFLFLTWPCVRIASGTDEIQRNILGERTLGLPPEPRVDKHVPFRDLVFSSTTRASVGGRRGARAQRDSDLNLT